MSGKNVAIILPALNEEASIGKVIDEIPVCLLENKGYKVEILVVDGGSSDKTQDIVLSKDARLIVEERSGKGRAVRTAFEQVTADYVIMADADFTYPMTDIPEILALLETEDVVIGSRLKGELTPGAMPRLNIFGNHLLTILANVLYRTDISDLCTGYWGFRKEVIDNMALQVNGFQFEAELYTELARKRYRIAEVPISYRPRFGRAKLNSIRDGWKIGWLLVKRRLSRQPH